MILLGVCKGASIIKYIGAHDRAPFMLIIGSGKDLTAGQISEGFHAFYSAFFFSMDVIESIKELRRTIKSDDIGVLRSEDIYDSIVNIDRSSQRYRELVEQEIDNIINKFPLTKKLGRPLLRIGAKNKIEKILKTGRLNRNRFLMRDLIDPKLQKKEDDLFGRINT